MTFPGGPIDMTEFRTSGTTETTRVDAGVLASVRAQGPAYLQSELEAAEKILADRSNKDRWPLAYGRLSASVDLFLAALEEK